MRFLNKGAPMGCRRFRKGVKPSQKINGERMGNLLEKGRKAFQKGV